MRFPDFFRTKEENFAFGGGLTPPKNKNFSFSLERIWASAPLRSENYWFSSERIWGFAPLRCENHWFSLEDF